MPSGFASAGIGRHDSVFDATYVQYDDAVARYAPYLVNIVANIQRVCDVVFVVDGSNTPATVTGFGSVFADVGQAHSTTIEYFDRSGTRLLTVVAPRRSD